MKFVKNVMEGSVSTMVERMFMKYGHLLLRSIQISGGVVFAGFILKTVPNTRELGITIIMIGIGPLMISIGSLIIGGSLAPRPPRDG